MKTSYSLSATLGEAQRLLKYSIRRSSPTPIAHAAVTTATTVNIPEANMVRQTTICLTLLVNRTEQNRNSLDLTGFVT